jgi:nitroreductase
MDMDALELLLGRASAGRLTEPAPSQGELDIMFQAAVRAPDHGRLRPWQFVVVPAERRVAFGEVLARSLLKREPDAPEPLVQRERDKALRAPIIVVVAARVAKGHKIPEAEQVASAAAAAQNVLLAAHAQGYGAMWRTGAPAYDPDVAAALGLGADSSIVGFLYMGTRAAEPMASPRPQPAEFVRVWEG